jgi:hypothetical protein
MTLRWVLALSVLVSAAVHLWLWFDGYRDIELIGPLFMLNAVAGLLIAVAVLVWRHWLPVLAATGFGAATLLAFLLSATVGLGPIQMQVLRTWEIVAGLSEIVSVVVGLLLLARSLQRHPRPARQGTRA